MTKFGDFKCWNIWCL